jgi:hypothetical protein
MFDDILRQRSVTGSSSVCHWLIIGLSLAHHRSVTGSWMLRVMSHVIGFGLANAAARRLKIS